MIDWLIEVKNYNNTNNTNFINSKELLETLYSTNSLSVVEDALHISRTAICRQMRICNIPINSKGWPHYSPLLLEMMQLDKDYLIKHSVAQIAQKLSASVQGVRNNLHKLGIRLRGE